MGYVVVGRDKIGCRVFYQLSQFCHTRIKFMVSDSANIVTHGVHSFEFGIAFEKVEIGCPLNSVTGID